jgi:integrase
MHAPALRDWIVAGVLTGLRPCEWSSAKVEGRVLTVRNAKHGEGWRGLGPTRHLELSTLAPADFAAVRHMVQRGARWVAEGDYGKHQDACSDLLRRMNLKLWPKRTRKITLYSFRHQYAANGKAGDPAELAASMGHLAERSAFRSYGKSRDGWGSKSPPRPGVSADAVACVRRNGPRSRQPVSPSA